MAMLAVSGELDQCITFPTRADLPGIIDALPDLPTEHRGMWEDLRDHDVPAPVAASVDRLLHRSSA